MYSPSFGNYGDVTTNGSQMGSFGFAANQKLGMGGPMAGASASPMPNVNVATPTTPQVAGAGNNAMGQQGSGFWSKEGGAGLVLGGIQVLGNLWNSFQAHKMAKEQMAFAREQWDTNLTNQTQTYNTALEDRIRARHNTEGRSSGKTDAYLDKHKL